MYRLYDFHSDKAPKLKIAARPTFKFSFLNQDSDSSEEEEEEENEPDEADYSHLFKVMAGEYAVYIDDPLVENEAGWTPLHTTCMSLGTVEAGLLLIEETVRRGGSFETKTRHGPGHFNKGWTPLHVRQLDNILTHPFHLYCVYLSHKNKIDGLCIWCRATSEQVSRTRS